MWHRPARAWTGGTEPARVDHPRLPALITAATTTTAATTAVLLSDMVDNSDQPMQSAYQSFLCAADAHAYLAADLCIPLAHCPSDQEAGSARCSLSSASVQRLQREWERKEFSDGPTPLGQPSRHGRCPVAIALGPPLPTALPRRQRHP